MYLYISVINLMGHRVWMGNHPDVEKVRFPKYQMEFPYALFCCVFTIHLCDNTNSREHIIMYMFTANSVQKVTQELA